MYATNKAIIAVCMALAYNNADNFSTHSEDSKYS